MKKEKPKKAKNITVCALFCKKCGSVIFSRARHDYRSCTCKALAIDGGFDYNKISFTNENEMIYFKAILPKELTTSILFEDWNKGIDKFGLYEYNKCHEWPIWIHKGLLKQEISFSIKRRKNEKTKIR